MAQSLEGQLPGGHEKSIVRTLLHSVRQLAEEGVNLLRLSCVLDSGAPIPFALARAPLRARFNLSEEFGASSLTQGINDLENHSLVALAAGEADRDAYLVHNLVRYTLLQGDLAGQDAPRLRQLLHRAAVAVLADLLDGRADIPDEALLLLSGPASLARLRLRPTRRRSLPGAARAFVAAERSIPRRLVV
ncbi:MAG: hypothetical protein LJE70_18190 [Chromatiaceae bacterium]|nr:hypothetical protein [Chromatiaceae bacterium]